jgi:hypothetical protein
VRFSHRADANSFAGVQSTYTFVAEARPPHLLHEYADGDSSIESPLPIRMGGAFGSVLLGVSLLVPGSFASAFLSRRFNVGGAGRPLTRPSDECEGEVPCTEGVPTSRPRASGVPIWAWHKGHSASSRSRSKSEGRPPRIWSTSPMRIAAGGGARRRRKGVYVASPGSRTTIRLNWREECNEESREMASK